NLRKASHLVNESKRLVLVFLSTYNRLTRRCLVWAHDKHAFILICTMINIRCFAKIALVKSLKWSTQFEVGRVERTIGLARRSQVRTIVSAHILIKKLTGIIMVEIRIKPVILQHFKFRGHRPGDLRGFVVLKSMYAIPFGIQLVSTIHVVDNVLGNFT